MNDLRMYALSNFEKSLNSKVAKKLEISVFNFTLNKARKENVQRSWSDSTFKMYYKNKVRSLIFNLKHGTLVKHIENKSSAVANIPYLTPCELWPEKYEAYFQKKLAKEMIQLQQLAEEENTSGMYTCRKCKSNCTSFFSLQTRSADEPMTNYITCKKCGNKWKD